MNTEENFKKVTAVVGKNKNYGNIIHDVCHIPNVTNLKQFYEIYELEEKSIDDKYVKQPDFTPTVELFEEVFRKFEEYPHNLQKLRKQPSTRERSNSNISKSSPTLSDSTGSDGISKETSTSLLNKLDIPTASETLNTFVKFENKLKQLDSEVSQNIVEKEYVNKFKQMNIFSQHLEKLSPTEKFLTPALTSDEESILDDMVVKMSDINFIRKHHDVFHQQNGSTNHVTQKVNSVTDMLSSCLLALNSLETN